MGNKLNYFMHDVIIFILKLMMRLILRNFVLKIPETSSRRYLSGFKQVNIVEMRKKGYNNIQL